jgi:sugar lactone lactonase YvrE
MLWQAVSGVLVLAGGLAAALDAPRWAVALLLATGLGGVLVTIARNVTYALRSDLAPLTGPRLGLRAAIAWLHFLQPIARAWGRVRGTLTPPEVAQRTPAPAEPSVRPSLRDGARAARLLFGGVIEDRFWSETWTSADQVLARLTAGLHRSRPGRRVAVDDGWSEDRDVSLLVGRWAWLDLRALVEEHERGRCLLRVGTSLRPTVLGVTAAVGIGAALTAAVIAGLAYRWPLASAVAALTTLGIGLFTATRTTLTSAIARQSVERVAASHEMLAFPTGPAPAPLSAPSLLHAYGLRSIAALVVTIFWFGAGTLLLRRAAIADVTDAGTDAPTGTLDGGGPGMSVWLDTPGGIAVDAAGDILVVDSHVALVRRIDGKTLLVSPFAGSEELGAGFSGDGGPATAARLNEPDGVAIAPDGDVLIADSQNHRIRRVDRETGIITTIAGSGEATFDGDGKPALETALDQPSAVASAANGDIYIADTMNNRIRRIDHASGLIHTVAGDGQVTEMGPVGDGGPATAAQLYMPSDVAVAPNGDVYIADMHHNRVRRIDATTGVITTVAGDGLFGKAPDGVLATEASLAGPAGIAVMMGPDAQTTLFIADSYNALVRMVGPDGVMRIVSDGSGVTFAAPSRVAYAPTGGWLYVGDAMEDKLVALIPQVSVEQASAPPGRPGRTDAPDR